MPDRNPDFWLQLVQQLENSELFLRVLNALQAIGAGIIGGIVDYLNQVNQGKRVWSFSSFGLHILTACFFGWVISQIVTGLGHGSGTVGAAAGLGGFLGTRVADIGLRVIDRLTAK